MVDVSKFSDGTNSYDIKDVIARNGLSNKQDTLVSGTNIKTINGNSILGEGNIVISGEGGSSSWGNITGTLSDQTDLQGALDDKSKVSMKDWEESTTTNLDELVINTLTQEEYDDLVENDQVNDNELYMIPDEEFDTSVITTLVNTVNSLESRVEALERAVFGNNN